MSERNRWSPWSLSKMEECGERYRRNIIENDRRPSGPAAARGRAVHTVASEANRRKLEVKRMLGKDRLSRVEMQDRMVPAEEVKSLADDAFNAAVLEGVELSMGDKAEGKNLNAILAEERKAALKLGETYIVGVAPTIDPVAVEREIVTEPFDPVTREKLPFDLKGRVDLIEISKGPETIRDTKTSSKSIPANAADTSTQLTMYSLLRYSETGTLVEDVALDNLILTASGNSSIKRMTSKRGPAHFQALLHRLKAAESAVQAGIFVPNTDSWRCTPKWCEYYGDCKYVVKPVQFAVNVGLDLSAPEPNSLLEAQLQSSIARSSSCEAACQSACQGACQTMSQQPNNPNNGE